MNSIRIKKGLTINQQVLFCMLLFFPLFTPAQDALKIIFGNSLGAIALNTFRAWNILAVCIGLYMVGKKKRIDYQCACILVHCIILAFSTVLHGEISFFYLLRVLGSISLLFVVATMYKGINIIYYIQAMYYVLTVVSFCTSLSIYLFFPEGMGSPNHYLFGLDNISFIYAFHGFSVGWIYNIIKSRTFPKKFFTIYIFIFSAYLYVRTGTGTIIIVMIIIVLLMSIWARRILLKINYFIATVACLSTFAFFVIIQNFKIVEKILYMIGKDPTLNGRTRIWEVGIDVIKNNAILGIGISDQMAFDSLASAGLHWTIDIGHLHNLVLEILFKGGVLGLIPIILVWFLSYKKMKLHRNSILEAIISILTILSWLACLFEFRITTYSFWILYILAYRIDDLNNIYLKEEMK